MNTKLSSMPEIVKLHSALALHGTYVLPVVHFANRIFHNEITEYIPDMEIEFMYC